jgi:hypothetical protein
LQQIVTSLNSTSTVVLSQTTQVQNSILDLEKSTSDKFEELTAMQNMLDERLDILRVVLGPMVKVAVSNASAEVHADLDETKKYGRLDSSPLSLADPEYSTYTQQIGPTASTGHQRPSKNTRAARQIRYERTFCLLVRDNHFAIKFYSHPGNIVLQTERTGNSRYNKYKEDKSQHPTEFVDHKERRRRFLRETIGRHISRRRYAASSLQHCLFLLSHRSSLQVRRLCHSL